MMNTLTLEPKRVSIPIMAIPTHKAMTVHGMILDMMMLWALVVGLLMMMAQILLLVACAAHVVEVLQRQQMILKSG